MGSKVHLPHPTNGANRHGIRKVWKVGTMVETIQTVRPPNFLSNMIKKIPYTGHTLPPCDLRAIFTARHECTTPQLKGPQQSVGVRIPNSRGHTEVWESVSPTQGATQKRGSPYPQLKGPH